MVWFFRRLGLFVLLLFFAFTQCVVSKVGNPAYWLSLFMIGVKWVCDY